MQLRSHWFWVVMQKAGPAYFRFSEFWSCRHPCICIWSIFRLLPVLPTSFTPYGKAAGSMQKPRRHPRAAWVYTSDGPAPLPPTMSRSTPPFAVLWGGWASTEIRGNLWTSIGFNGAPTNSSRLVNHLESLFLVVNALGL